MGLIQIIVLSITLRKMGFHGDQLEEEPVLGARSHPC